MMTSTSKYRKIFTYGEKVRVVQRGRRTITGKVYSEYDFNGPRIICVELKSGAGIGFPADKVRKLRRSRPRRVV